ncbi:DUF1192 domain-containing protein [Pseudovibrio exalbescens]|uniref:Uncharacterized protein n=1 Tax=Pseudovibrio exalbescens TaxID=197461 RepID=A0A1U7JH29_9HYPH|nr:DUF1192 domain-containing protein [Pseudovibrio exalbescens]OKL44050.1 hypothetical protein A3843_10750 [Pseudovibrio exalbescens]
MGLFDDEEPIKKNPRDIIVGETLENFSSSELEERVTLLRAEIERTEKELKNKASASEAAHSLFK